MRYIAYIMYVYTNELDEYALPGSKVPSIARRRVVRMYKIDVFSFTVEEDMKSRVKSLQQ